MIFSEGFHFSESCARTAPRRHGLKLSQEVTALARTASGAPEGERAPQADALRKQRCLWRASAPEVPVHGNMHRRRADQINLRLAALRFPLYVPEASLFCAYW